MKLSSRSTPWKRTRPRHRRQHRIRHEFHGSAAHPDRLVPRRAKMAAECGMATKAWSNDSAVGAAAGGSGHRVTVRRKGPRRKLTELLTEGAMRLSDAIQLG